MVGTQIGPYKILEKVGKGGMAVVYKGVHAVLEQEVAVKVLLSEYAQDPAMRERFVNEARIQAKLSHPNVVNILNYIEDGDNVFLVMEFIDGLTLDSHLVERGALPLDEAVLICSDVLKALAFMHARGVIHRDIKPSNIMFTREGLVKVTDFGIAKAAGVKGLTRTGMRIGTLWYMSPEQIQGRQASVTSDIYSAGVTLYQMVTGRVPFSGDSEYSIMKGHLEEPPVPPWEINKLVSPSLGTVILKALAKDPGERFQDCNEFVRTLDHARQREDADRLPRAEGAAEPLAGVVLGTGRNPLLSVLPGLSMWQYAVIAAGLAVILFVLLYFLLMSPKERTTINIMGSSAPHTVIVDSYASAPQPQPQTGSRGYEARPPESSPRQSSPPPESGAATPPQGTPEQGGPPPSPGEPPAPRAGTEQLPPGSAGPPASTAPPEQSEEPPRAVAPETGATAPDNAPPAASTPPAVQPPPPVVQPVPPVAAQPEPPVVGRVEERPINGGTPPVSEKPQVSPRKEPAAPRMKKPQAGEEVAQQPEPQQKTEEEAQAPSRKSRQEHTPWRIRK